MKKSELKKLIREVLSEQSLKSSNGKLRDKLIQLKTAIDRKLAQMNEQRMDDNPVKDPKPVGTSREEYENPLFKLIDRILCFFDPDCEGVD